MRRTTRRSRPRSANPSPIWWPAAPGFAPQSQIGRVALGVASGTGQNHNYVYAEVQDTLLLNTQKLLGLDIPSLPDPLGLGIDPSKTATVLNGVYMSADFGRSWHEMESSTSFELPGNGSTQTPSHRSL